MAMTTEGGVEIPRPQSIRDIEQANVSEAPVDALAIQRAQVAEYLQAVYDLTGLDADDLHSMGSAAIVQSITNAQGERAA